MDKTLYDFVVTYHDHGGYTWEAHQADAEDDEIWEIPVEAVIDRFWIRAADKEKAVAWAKDEYRRSHDKSNMPLL